MPTRHILIHSLHRITSRHLTVLLVHVVRARTGVVADPDTEVLDLLWLLLLDLVQTDNFSIGLLDFAEFGEEVPESGLGYDIVGGEDAHAIEFGGRVAVGWQMAANDLVFR